MWKRLAAVTVALGIAQAVSPPASSAQPFDHLKCYRVKDPHKFDAVANLVPLLNPPFTLDSGCKIKVRATKLCTPVEKELQSTTAPGVQFPSQELENNYLCYKVKCPKAAVADLEVTDQFGTRTLSKFTTREICSPTVLGAEPPFTCTDQNALTCGEGSCPPGQECALNLAGLACECQGGGGGSTTTTLPGVGGLCGNQTFPVCALGTCPAGTCMPDVLTMQCLCQ